MTITIPANARGLDYAYPHATLRSPARIKGAGFSFVVRYVSSTASNTKNATPAECQALLNMGIAVLLVFEDSATTPLGGYFKGLSNGVTATLRAAALGYPKDCVVMVAVDTDVIAGNIATVESYVRAFAASCGYPIGIYGDRDILQRCLDISRINWIPNASAWSGGVVPPFVHVKQFRTDLANGWDPNTALQPFTGAWSLTHVASSPPTHVEIPAQPAPPKLVNFNFISRGESVIRILRSFSGEFDAQFFAVTAPGGASCQVEWTGNGANPRVLQRIEAHKAAFAAATGQPADAIYQDINTLGLQQNRLIGGVAAEIVDSKRGWSDTDFAVH